MPEKQAHAKTIADEGDRERNPVSSAPVKATNRPLQSLESIAHEGI
jgi:hypothetical protein